MTLQLAHIFLTELRTFIVFSVVLALSIHDSAFGQIVGRELHDHAIAREDTDVVLANPSRDMAEHHMLVVELHSEC